MYQVCRNNHLICKLLIFMKQSLFLYILSHLFQLISSRTASLTSIFIFQNHLIFCLLYVLPIKAQASVFVFFKISIKCALNFFYFHCSLVNTTLTWSWKRN